MIEKTWKLEYNNFATILGLIGLGVGILLVLASFFITPIFVANYFTPDGILEEDTIQRIQLIRFSAVVSGIFTIVFGALIYIYPSTVNRFFDLVSHKRESFHLKTVNKILYGIFFGGLTFYFVFYLFNAYVSITYPYQLGYGEEFILNQAHLITQGSSIYQDITRYPYIIGNYPPVYPLICASLVKLFGTSFATGRFISVLSTILIGLLIYKIVKEKANNQIALISSLLFFGSAYVYFWTCQFRVDTLGLLFSLAGIYLVFKYENTKKVYWSTFPFILALFTKQSLIAAPIASFIYLFLKNRKQGIKCSVLFGLSCVLLFLLINHITNGQFYLHTVVYNANPFGIDTAIAYYFMTILIHLILFGFAFAYVLYAISKKELSLFVIYFIFSALVAVTVGKVGSFANYMIELIAVSCILFGLALKKLKLQIGRENSIASILVLTLLITQLVTFAFILSYSIDFMMPTSADINDGQTVSSYVINAGDTILSEDGSFIVVNGKTVLFQPFVFTQIQRQGLWDQSKLVSDIETENFSLIILRFYMNNDEIHEIHRSRLTDEMINAIKDSYYLVKKIGDYYIYMPNKGGIEAG